MTTGLSGAVVNSHEIVTGDFTRDTEFRIPGEDLALALQARLQDGQPVRRVGAGPKLLGDTIFTNQMLLGAAWQRGLIPLSREAILAGGGAERRRGGAQQAGLRDGPLGHREPRGGRAPDRPEVVEKPKTLDEKIAFRAAHLTAYQGKRLAKRYRKLVDTIDDPRLKEAVAKGVSQASRLQGRIRGRAAASGDRGQGAGGLRWRFHAEIPPRAADAARQGRRRSPEEARIRGLDRAPLPDPGAAQGPARHAAGPFGYTAERRMERGLIRQYQADMAEFLPGAAPQTMDALVALAELPLSIRGFGPVKERTRGRPRTARGPDRPSARGRGADGRGCRIGAGRRRRRSRGRSARRPFMFPKNWGDEGRGRRPPEDSYSSGGSGPARAGRCRSRPPAGPRAGRACWRRAAAREKLHHPVAHRPDMGREHRRRRAFFGRDMLRQGLGRAFQHGARLAAASASSGVALAEVPLSNIAM
jgi:hypothetical protein